MSKNAPDTRNKLDSNKPVKKKNTNTKRITLGDLPKKVAKSEKKDLPLKLNANKKATSGQLFKEANGFSKSMKKNLLKKDLLPVIESVLIYRKIRKDRKILETKAKQEKHKASAAYKRANGKKGKAPAKKAASTIK